MVNSLNVLIFLSAHRSLCRDKTKQKLVVGVIFVYTFHRTLVHTPVVVVVVVYENVKINFKNKFVVFI